MKKNGLVNTTIGSNVFGSVRDAMTKKISLYCMFTDDLGRQTTTYVKNGIVRADMKGKSANDSGSVIINNGRMYFWNEQTNTGFVMRLNDDTHEFLSDSLKMNGVASAEGVIETIEKYKDQCKVANIDDSLFTTPANIKFQDLASFSASGAGAPSINSTDLQKYLK
jgi:hypothetical protein